MVKNILIKTIHFLMKAYWRLVKPFSIGVRALVINDQNQVLLIKHTYSDSWYLPGGGVNKQEHLLDALYRELDEELKLIVKTPPILLGSFTNFHEHKSDFITVFVVASYTMNPSTNFEIEKWAYFDLENIPATTSRGTKRRLQEYYNKQPLDYKW